MTAITQHPITSILVIDTWKWWHYNDVITGAMASQITRFMIVFSTFYSGADQRKHQSSASLALVRGIHRWPVNSLHKWPVARKMFSFDDVIIRPWGSCLLKVVGLFAHVWFSNFKAIQTCKNSVVKLKAFSKKMHFIDINWIAIMHIRSHV